MRPWLVVVALAAAALAACSHPSESATTPKPLVVEPCKRAADQIIDLLGVQAQDSGRQIGPDLYKQMSDSLVERCEKDKWSAQAQQCATAAKTPDEFGKCEDKFTQAQLDALIGSVGGDTRKRDQAPDGAGAVGGAGPGGPAGGGGAATGAAPPPAAAAPAASPPPPSPAPSNTRGAKQKSKTSDPCEGGQ
jgi:hypothetical protein